MLYVPPGFKKCLTINASVDSGAYGIVIAESELEGIKQQAPTNIFKVDDPPNFRIQVANGELQKPMTTATVKFDIAYNTFAKYFVLVKKLTGPIIRLHFMRHKSVLIDISHGFFQFPHLTMQVKTANGEKNAKPQPVLSNDITTIAPMTTKTVDAFVDHPSEWNTTNTVTPLERFTEEANLLTSHSMSTSFDISRAG